MLTYVRYLLINLVIKLEMKKEQQKTILYYDQIFSTTIKQSNLHTKTIAK